SDPMKQSQFEAEYAPLWEEISAVLESRQAQQTQQENFPALYRRLCQCLALSSQRGYSPALTDYLQQMVAASHKRLYGAMTGRPHTLLRWLSHDFPQRVRAEWRLLLLAALAFWGVVLVTGLLVWQQPQWAYSFMSAEQLRSVRHMYQPSQMHLGRGGVEGDLMMFGFYIWNNVSIGFRTFASGIFGGIPSLLSLAGNGVNGGVVAAWLSIDPATRATFWPFVATHSSFEITGLLLSGVAGMRLGLALIHPGRLSRRHALLNASQYMFPVIVGAALLTVLAAFFEAFWSASSAIPVNIKYTVAAICWTLVIAFFIFAGRMPHQEASDAS
ncbi:stage II sporulation protein M, partial [Undibacterium sp.]|uniref:stage II sporulation protein M n=1 Tax=Undibacterium sp. TaxID=1914977 RepID=UPI00374DE4C3